MPFQFIIAKKMDSAGSAAILSPALVSESAIAKDLPPGKSLLTVKSLNSFQRNAERAAFLVRPPDIYSS